MHVISVLQNLTKRSTIFYMSIIFDQSAYKHFAEDRLSEDQIMKALRSPLWAALVDPHNDASCHPIHLKPPVTLFICKRHPGALDNDLIEIFVTMRGHDMHIFHVEHLTDRWKSYWRRYKDHGQI